MTAGARRRSAALLTALALAALGSGCGASARDKPAQPASVALHAHGAPDSLVIGVVVSLSSSPGQGAQWSAAAEGAQVAGYRYRKGDVQVDIVPVNDKGTARGAQDAVRRLVDQHVSGIVLATAGSHLRGALDAAEAAGVPVLLPYDPSVSDLPSVAWATGPDRDEIGSTLAEAIQAEAVHRLLLVDAGGGTPDHVQPAERLRFRAGGDTTKLAKEVRRMVRPRSSDPIDGVLVSGPADLQAQVVATMQGGETELPVFVTPQALSPTFATSLDKAGGTLGADLTTVGAASADTTAMQPGTAGDAASAFFAALRAAAADPSVQDFFDDQPFSDAAPLAATPSHDAVVALVTAAARAGSAAPGDVLKSLQKLRVTGADGLAGPDLDFADKSALDPDQVTVLGSTPQDPGLRPSGDAGSPQIYWFTTPSA